MVRRLSEVALAAFRLTACRDYARVDMRMDDAGRVYVLEVNGNPDIGPNAGFARALRVAGISYEDFVDDMVRQAVAERVLRAPGNRKLAV
jgi:D-alanine-D-alanine ligase